VTSTAAVQVSWISISRSENGTEHDPRIALAYAAKIEALIGCSKLEFRKETVGIFDALVVEAIKPQLLS
jgi:hypothetical protein